MIAPRKKAAKPTMTAVERRNAMFAAMNPSERRVAIAKDVIKQLRSKKKNKIVPAHVYFYGYLKKELLEGVKDFSEVVDKVEGCKCCGIGALLLSKVRLFNDVPIDRVNDGESDNFPGSQCIGMNRGGITAALDGFFDVEQLRLIECAFEIVGYYNNPEHVKAMTFGEKFEDLSSRLIAIMQNVAANNGTFKP